MGNIQTEGKRGIVDDGALLQQLFAQLEGTPLFGESNQEREQNSSEDTP